MTEVPAAAPDLAEHYAHCEGLVRDGDRAEWLAALFAPAAARPAFHALRAFALDVSSIRRKVREPLAGELRMQWWTDAIEGETRGDVRGHPVAAALLDTIRRHRLPRSVLTGFVDTKRSELYDEPLATMDAFDQRADQIEGAFCGLKAQVLIARRDPAIDGAARRAGHALAALSCARDIAAGTIAGVPRSVLDALGTDAGTLRARTDASAFRAVLLPLETHANAEQLAMRQLGDTVPQEAGAAFLTVSLVAPTLRRLTRAGFDLASDPVDLPQWRQQWVLWRASRRDGFG